MELDMIQKVSVRLEGPINISTENYIYVEHLNKKFSIDVPNHITKEDRLRLKGLGKQSPDGRKGDLFLEFDKINNVGVYKNKSLVCVKCGQQLLESSNFCSNCGCTVRNNDDEKQSQRKIIYEGEIHKCPNCGEVMGSFMANCPSCGYEFRGVKAVKSVRELAIKLEEIESKREHTNPNIMREFLYGKTTTKTDEQKISLIKNFSIPNTKEDLYEFLILASSNINVDMYDEGTVRNTDVRLAMSDAWRAKFEQAYQKAKIIFVNDPRMTEIEKIYTRIQRSISSAKKNHGK